MVEPLLKNLGQGILDFGEKPWQTNVAKLAVNFNIARSFCRFRNWFPWPDYSD